nr:helix-turn-helix domain-containing protein [Lacticaseibacillus camelliae]
MHYSEIDNLVPVILAVQEEDNDAITLLLELFGRDIDYEARYGQRHIDPDLRQELQIKLIYIAKCFDVEKHLAISSKKTGQKKNIIFFLPFLSFRPAFIVCIYEAGFYFPANVL